MSELKKKVICIQTGSTLQDAKNLMAEKRIRHLPVINESDKIVGMLSSRDLSDDFNLLHLPVDYFYQFPVEYATLDTPLRTIALTMLEKKISSLLLIDNEKKVQGIITADDLIFHLAELLKPTEEKKGKSWTELDVLVTAGEVFRKLSDIGI